jgi:hypothetical protein
MFDARVTVLHRKGMEVESDGGCGAAKVGHLALTVEVVSVISAPG